MDNITTDLIIIASHRAQLSSLLATHWGSALAIALRKLNRSYSKRMAELGDAARRVEMLEGEVAEAWSEADRLAREMDELEEFADTIKVTKTEPLISPSFSYPSPYLPSLPFHSSLQSLPSLPSPSPPPTTTESHQHPQLLTPTQSITTEAQTPSAPSALPPDVPASLPQKPEVDALVSRVCDSLVSGGVSLQVQ